VTCCRRPTITGMSEKQLSCAGRVAETDSAAITNVAPEKNTDLQG